MEEINNDLPQPNPPRRRRKRSKWQNFKEAYLPIVIAALALILILVFIVGAVKHGKSGSGKETTAPLESTTSQEQLLKEEANALLAQAEALVAHYDYEGAMDVLNSYSGGINNSPELMARHTQYTDAFSKLIPFTDVDKVPNLCFNMLIQDLPRSLSDETYGSKYNENFITTGEFRAILQQLYDNGYVLVSPHELAPAGVTPDGKTVLTKGTIYLPEGKKPLVLTQQGVNYYTYMVDGDGDGKPDKDGAGFASKLVLQPDGSLANEMVGSDGNVSVGAYDLIPILDEFVAAHPDFSYKGAKAVIAVTGYDGLFGYRTDPETATKISQEYYDADLAAVVPVIQAVKDHGYDIACFTYDYIPYGNSSTEEIQQDLALWSKEVMPLLGNVDILVYPHGSDIGNTDPYGGEQYQVLSEFGFRYFIGQDTSSQTWGQITGDYFRQTRRWATGSNLAHNAGYFTDLFDPATVLETTARGEIPG